MNGAAWGIVAPNHILTFVTTSLSEYIFVLDVLEFYPPYFARALSESAIRIGIRVDLHRHINVPKRMFLLSRNGGSIKIPGWEKKRVDRRAL